MLVSLVDSSSLVRMADSFDLACVIASKGQSPLQVVEDPEAVELVRYRVVDRPPVKTIMTTMFRLQHSN
jgi:hypothetical protein